MSFYTPDARFISFAGIAPATPRARAPDPGPNKWTHTELPLNRAHKAHRPGAPGPAHGANAWLAGRALTIIPAAAAPGTDDPKAWAGQRSRTDMRSLPIDHYAIDISGQSSLTLLERRRGRSEACERVTTCLHEPENLESLSIGAGC